MTIRPWTARPMTIHPMTIHRSFTKRGIDEGSATGLTVQNCMLTVSGTASHENENTPSVEYDRVTNTTQNSVLIDKATRELYRQLELEYGVSLEVTKDAQGRFRGSPAHIGSVDATHVVACAKGSQATSCIFEKMCDDATNQHAHHSRLADVRDMGDGKDVSSDGTVNGESLIPDNP